MGGSEGQGVGWKRWSWAAAGLLGLSPSSLLTRRVSSRSPPSSCAPQYRHALATYDQVCVSSLTLDASLSSQCILMLLRASNVAAGSRAVSLAPEQPAHSRGSV